ncbi:rhamnogalacturonan acetylesterase [Plectosphaerella plurivora]|uniref:Rhamnogalacturonan acetylesterase n=1 Tax=Plectosphaerella plurivora TaxID=936078 RepID=A0A9P8V0P5_9PEZI|nr:rhamnogalacturonan acetylesterase [Plectosphaerella plurivora]
MKSVFSLVAALALSATQVASQTVYLCGDSTMARSSDGVTQGWGQYIGNYLTLPVVNRAIGGRSARSYTVEGRFQATADLVKSGDIVVIEFGHNDGGSPASNDNGRSDCPGAGTETCISDKTGETVYTFVFYVAQAAKLFLSKGATVILSTQTPNNQWEFGTWNGAAPRFVGYQNTATKAIADSRVTFVDHFAAVTKMYLKLGNTAVNALYPNDHTHTSPRGAELSAQAFAQAIYQKMNGTTSLATRVKTPVTIVY